MYEEVALACKAFSWNFGNSKFLTTYEILRAGTKRCWRNAGPGERCCREKDVAEKEPEDTGAVLPSSKRHCTTFFTAFYPKTYQTREIWACRWWYLLAHFSGGKREQIHLLQGGDNTKTLWSLKLDLLLPIFVSFLFLWQTSFQVMPS